MLQFLVDDFCCRWAEDTDLRKEISMQKKFPIAFTMRVMRRLSELLRDPDGAKMDKCCYLEHASDVERKACKQQHMVFHEFRECGYFE